jgi:hypothetical protein
MLHSGKTFKADAGFATLRMQSGKRQVVVVLHGRAITPRTGPRGDLVFPRHTPRLLKRQARRAAKCKMRLDTRLALC